MISIYNKILLSYETNLLQIISFVHSLFPVNKTEDLDKNFFSVFSFLFSYNYGQDVSHVHCAKHCASEWTYINLLRVVFSRDI